MQQPNGQPPAPPSIEQQMFQKKVDDFFKELHALQNKYGLQLLPVIIWSKFGAQPDLEVHDQKQLQQMMSNVQPKK